MGRPLKSVFKKEHRDDIANRSANPVFSEVAEVFLSRRRFLQMGAVAGAAVSFPFLIKPENAIAAVSKPSALAKAVSTGLYQHRRLHRRYGQGAGRLYCPPVLSLG